jgi:hypothetical protein
MNLDQDLIYLCIPIQFSELEQYNFDYASIRPPLNLFIVTYKLTGIGITFTAIQR